MNRRFAVFLSVLSLLILYTGGKAAGLFPGHAWAAWTGTALFFAFIVGWQFWYRSRPLDDESPGARALAWSATIAMGVWATFLFYCLAADLAVLAFGLLMRHGAPSWLPGSLLGAACVTAALGFLTVRAGPVVREVSVPIAGLPPALKGLRIAQISDLHVGATIREGYVRDVVARVMALAPDLIAVTGDLADGSVEKLARHVAPLSGLKAPLGVYFVTGNHEYYAGAEAWLAKVAELGFTALLNENRVVERAGARVLVGGVTDSSAGHFIASHRSDPAKAALTDSAAGVRILLAHRPDSCFAAEKAGFQLQLSGHTHGGQFFPWKLLIPFFHPYSSGLNRHGDLWVYVNSGTGYWGPPHRFAVPSEITSLRLE